MSSFVFSPSGTAPWRCSSANPRMEVSGVRSSWLASATNRRSLFSVSVRAVKDSSIRESIWFSEVLNRPTSVSGSKFSRRADRSPAAIFSAVASILVSGFMPILITCREANAINKSTRPPIIRKTTPILWVVLSNSLKDCATITEPRDEGKTVVATRKSEPGASIVNGSEPKAATCPGSNPRTYSVTWLELRSPPIPPIKFPKGSKTVTEIDVGTRLSGVATRSARGPSSSSSSRAIPA